MNKEQREFHRSRREKLMKRIGKDSIAIILSNSKRNKSFDASYKYKQNKNFFYLTGFEEPNSILVLAPGGLKVKDKSKGKKISLTEILFVQKKDPKHEKWDGKRLGYENVKNELGISHARENNDFPEVISANIGYDFNNIYLNIIELYDAEGEMKNIVTPFIDTLRVSSSWAQICDVSNILGEMRKIKSPFELKQIQKAADITAYSMNEALKQLHPGMYEYQIQSLLEFNYLNNGAPDIAFDTIVASGENACILHYITNREKIKKGSLVLIDTGAEYNNYCADITRTFPANGKFSKEQRVIYEIVLKANKAGIKMSKAGTKYSKLDKHIKKLMADELVKRKIIKDSNHIGRFCYHGIGHDLGLDTHDAVPFGLNPAYDTLKSGNVITVEPGIYFPSGTDGFDSKYRGIGVRIEDDVVVTPKGGKVLTGAITKEPDEIERIMNT